MLNSELNLTKEESDRLKKTLLEYVEFTLKNGGGKAEPQTLDAALSMLTYYMP